MHENKRVDIITLNSMLKIRRGRCAAGNEVQTFLPACSHLQSMNIGHIQVYESPGILLQSPTRTYTSVIIYINSIRFTHTRSWDQLPLLQDHFMKSTAMRWTLTKVTGHSLLINIHKNIIFLFSEQDPGMLAFNFTSKKVALAYNSCNCWVGGASNLIAVPMRLRLTWVNIWGLRGQLLQDHFNFFMKSTAMRWTLIKATLTKSTYKTMKRHYIDPLNSN